MAFTTEEQQADAVLVGQAALKAVRAWSGMMLPQDADADEVAAYEMSSLIQCLIASAQADRMTMSCVFYGLGLGLGGLFAQMDDEEAGFLCDELERGHDEGVASIHVMSRPKGNA